jgi:hypothetical protein
MAGMVNMEPPNEKRQELPEEEHTKNVWRGSPRIWERCVFCDLRKKCSSAGVVRGTSACIDARYTLMKGT